MNMNLSPEAKAVVDKAGMLLAGKLVRGDVRGSVFNNPGNPASQLEHFRWHRTRNRENIARCTPTVSGFIIGKSYSGPDGEVWVVSNRAFIDFEPAHVPIASRDTVIDIGTGWVNDLGTEPVDPFTQDEVATALAELPRDHSFYHNGLPAGPLSSIYLHKLISRLFDGDVSGLRGDVPERPYEYVSFLHC
jgi:hypothetical protein